METRRHFLKCALFSAIGLILAAEGVTRFNSTSRAEESSGTISPQSFLTGGMVSPSVSFLSVKVVYLQMAQYVELRDEYFVLQSTVTLKDLLVDVAKRHPSLATMMTSMWILVNGTPARSTTPLKDGDEVDLVPLVAGG